MAAALLLLQDMNGGGDCFGIFGKPRGNGDMRCQGQRG
jgi:hypothetical protein